MKQEGSWEFGFQPGLGVWLGWMELESLWKGSMEAGKSPFHILYGGPSLKWVLEARSSSNSGQVSILGPGWVGHDPQMALLWDLSEIHEGQPRQPGF